MQITQDDESVYVAIDDAGPGVPPEERERIFARFARTPTSRGSTQGTGLGLSLVAETALRHHGSVWCTHNARGGARFVLRLPLLAEPGDSPDSPVRAGLAGDAS